MKQNTIDLRNKLYNKQKTLKPNNGLFIFFF